MTDVFILGYTKCATTSLYNQLVKHGDISRTKRKEPHYHFSKVFGNRFSGPADNDTVSQMFVCSADAYRALYEPGKVRIDASAMSIESPEVLLRMDQDYPEAKYIVVLRNPIERAFSAYSHLIRDARETRSFREALEHELLGHRHDYLPIWRNIQSSRYVEAVQFARQQFGNRLMLINYDDYAKRNKETMNAVARFIGIKPIDWQPEKANRSGVPKSKIFQRLLMRRSTLKTLFVRYFPEHRVTQLKRFLLEANTSDKPILSEEDKQFFWELISDEKQKISPNSPDSDLLKSIYLSP